MANFARPVSPHMDRPQTDVGTTCPATSQPCDVLLAMHRLKGTGVLARALATLAFIVVTISTKVRFTVISEGYFDSPGSTITFQATSRAGNLYLSQHARAIVSQPWIVVGVGWLQLSKGTWAKQQASLRVSLRLWGAF